MKGGGVYETEILPTSVGWSGHNCNTHQTLLSLVCLILHTIHSSRLISNFECVIQSPLSKKLCTAGQHPRLIRGQSQTCRFRNSVPTSSSAYNINRRRRRHGRINNVSYESHRGWHNAIHVSGTVEGQAVCQVERCVELGISAVRDCERGQSVRGHNVGDRARANIG